MARIGWMIITLFWAGLLSAQPVLSPQQQHYQQALAALKQGDNDEFRRLRNQLKDYPLQPYLDFEHRSGQMHKLTAQQAVEILSSLTDTPLYDRFKHRYLVQAGKQKRWSIFLSISPQPPRNTDLRCYYYRARLAEGDIDTAWSGAHDLWLTDRSLPDACTPLLRAWQKAGQRNNAIIWQRMLLTFEGNQGQRLAYLNTLLSRSWRERGDLLVRLYQHPKEIRQRTTIKRQHKQAQQIAAVTLYRLARRAPEYALKHYLRWQGQLGEHESKVRTRIVRFALADNLWTPELAQLMESFPQDELIVLRTRQLIARGDWQAINHWLARIQNTEADDWQYWRARAMEELALTEEADAAYRALAKRRSYYGFLAAQRLGLPYRMNQTLPEDDPQLTARVSTLASVQRIGELLALDDHRAARSEWRWQLLRANKTQQWALTRLAYTQGWHYLSVQGTITAKSWDAVPWRFPDAYGDDFSHFARQQQLDDTLLRAVARRESALYPLARSGANAYGLMQLLPTTAKQVARQQKLRYSGARSLYQPRFNIQLGSAYLKQLMDQYQDNRILTAAAYNAGPSRVKRWLKNSDGKLAMDQFVDTIPYRETRDYVKAILSYQLIYRTLQQRPSDLVSQAEWQRRY
ncbi:transglycosylase SLT domain-containing protein [Ferrimonas kyonanensis]|uniref:transglycosylase SLT domain-containing protein n=1 Tax=Ferrimonas kyonanensis TaxID=364763 RepID=UPI0004281F38|nr:transglycosylase SLT domain-containing protein [Ferrimonas kyonanensis]